MYEEKKIVLSFRDIALQLLIIVLFVLLLLWLFPTKKNMKKYVDEKGGNNNTTINSNNNSENNNGSNTVTKTETKKETKKNTKKDTKKTTKTEKKQYEYIKKGETTYGEYGKWSDWSTTAVAASDTVEVETDVRSVAGSEYTYQVQTGTTTSNEVIGVIKNNKIFTGYDVKYLRTFDAPKYLQNIGDYLYVVTGATKAYKCSDGTVLTYEYNAPADIKNNAASQTNYEYLLAQNVEYNPTVASTCTNPSLLSENYKYVLFERVAKYTSKQEDVHGNVEVPVYENKTATSYNNVTYYRYRTRNKTVNQDSIKWSTKQNDADLISQGYTATGNVK